MYTNSINSVLRVIRSNVLKILIAVLLAGQFMFLIGIVNAEDENLIRDREYLISLAKKIESENKIDRRDLDNMDVDIYRKNTYIVVHFSPKQTPGSIMKGRDIAYYFIKKGADYQFIKALLGQ